jgi:hypothetical protein
MVPLISPLHQFNKYKDVTLIEDITPTIDGNGMQAGSHWVVTESWAGMRQCEKVGYHLVCCPVYVMLLPFLAALTAGIMTSILLLRFVRYFF